MPYEPVSCSHDAKGTPMIVALRRKRAASRRTALLRSLPLLALVAATSCIEEVKDPGFGETFEKQYVTGPNTLSWRKVDVGSSGSYRRLAVEPLQVRRFHLDWYQTVEAAALIDARTAYEECMRAVLARSYPFVERGEGTLRVSAALTDRITDPELLGVVRASRSPLSSGGGSLPCVGLEFDFRDGETGELVAAFVSVAEATAIQGNLTRPSGTSSWRPIFLPLAQRLKVVLDSARRN